MAPSYCLTRCASQPGYLNLHLSGERLAALLIRAAERLDPWGSRGCCAAFYDAVTEALPDEDLPELYEDFARLAWRLSPPPELSPGTGYWFDLSEAGDEGRREALARRELALCFLAAMAETGDL